MGQDIFYMWNGVQYIADNNPSLSIFKYSPGYRQLSLNI